ncbi:SDR family NAD(P)-dependent oxidoreductase [Methylobacillus sp.]|uniref:SDR family NAD(P)-dependent oxidoreductase n=1 Tax=Methylobacillus sp. TaxID=56818 RepID=UPI0012C0F136|nr:SDR family NAD(P)-dependent oxidoreductase [Methylobacillus sp.]MPS48016.1 SDR family NAD(P)-dependent oxidoreductase [Methylobacillus sp.]
MKTFLSIGTGPGIGFETAARFAQEGYRVVLSARNADKLNALAKVLHQSNHQVEVRTVNASNPASVIALIDEVENTLGPIDILHYNAANLRQATVEEQPADSFVSDLAVNIGGALAAIQAVKPRQESRGQGTILMTGGGFALYPSPDYLSLSIGKAGIRTITLGLFEPFKQKNVHIATVTVATFVSAGSKEARDIAEQFWQLHSQPQASWTAEIMYPA